MLRLKEVLEGSEAWIEGCRIEITSLSIDNDRPQSPTTDLRPTTDGRPTTAERRTTNDGTMSLFWNLMYLFRPPWDTGRPQPALVEWLKRTRPRPGRALDLGCGTGTNVIYLARHGFQVTGVDIARLAIARARRKARRAGVQARFLVADVTDLPPDLGPGVFQELTH